MKLELSREWFENNLPHDGAEVTAINPKHLAGDKDGSAALSDHHADEATDNVLPNVISERDHGIEPQP
jgi:hypothetical protein